MEEKITKSGNGLKPQLNRATQMSGDRDAMGYGAEPPEDVAPAHLAAILEGLAQARRLEFATDFEVEAASDSLPPWLGALRC